MRRIVPRAALAVAAMCLAAVPALAQTGNSVTGFGGLTVNASPQSLFGGEVGIGLTRNIQIVGEVGRVSNVLPSLVNRLVALTPVSLSVSSFYGEGGVRFLTDSPHAPFVAYAEATAGFARLSTRFQGISSVDPYVNTALTFLDRTSPMLGVGGGVIVGLGRAQLDLGYRYKRIINNDRVDQVLMLGNSNISINQVRVGVGVRF